MAHPAVINYPPLPPYIHRGNIDSMSKLCGFRTCRSRRLRMRSPLQILRYIPAKTLSWLSGYAILCMAYQATKCVSKEPWPLLQHTIQEQ
jgi:hypothetical protein